MGLAAGGLGAAPVLAGMAGGAAAGAVNSAVNGGNLGTNVLLGAAFGGFAGGVGGPLAQSLGGGFQGAVGSGAILGAAYGGIGAAAAGKNILTGMLAGAVSGALLAAAIYGGCKAFESIRSQALDETGGGTGSGGGLRARSPRYMSAEVDGVTIGIDPAANHPVDYALAEKFDMAVSLTKGDVPELESLYISSTVRPGTLHEPGFAIDISRVNGIRMAEGYLSNPVVTNVVKALQTNLAFVGAHENFGPYLMTGGRLSLDNLHYLYSTHQSHIHFSIRP